MQWWNQTHGLSGLDDAIKRTPPRSMTLVEQALEFVDDDKLVEVALTSVRLRKKELDPNQRKKKNK